jgi:hypothetical protein
MDIRKLSKITHKINKIKVVQNTIKNKWEEEFLKKSL